MDTFVACLTPPGSGAIATLGLHGPRALEVVRTLFRPSLLPTNPMPGSMWIGELGAELTDRVVVTVPVSEPVPVVEIQCHGGREVVRLLLETFTEQGLQLIDWRDWFRRTSKSAIEADLRIALAEASTTRTAAMVLGQGAGILEGAWKAIDTATTAAERARLAREMLRWAPLGLHLTHPWRVVIAGAPNAGKSSLVNAIAGYQRCVVSEIPGTTRDLVTTAIAIEGWPVELIDTAGLRVAEAAIEVEGIQRALAAIGTANLCLWVLDGSTNPVWPGSEWGEVMLLVNKTDQPPAWDWTEARNALRISAATGNGIGELCQTVAARLVPDIPAPGVALPITHEQVARLRELAEQSE